MTAHTRIPQTSLSKPGPVSSATPMHPERETPRRTSSNHFPPRLVYICAVLPNTWSRVHSPRPALHPRTIPNSWVQFGPQEEETSYVLSPGFPLVSRSSQPYDRILGHDRPCPFVRAQPKPSRAANDDSPAAYHVRIIESPTTPGPFFFFFLTRLFYFQICLPGFAKARPFSNR